MGKRRKKEERKKGGGVRIYYIRHFGKMEEGINKNGKIFKKKISTDDRTQVPWFVDFL